jgi:DNA polymerase-4
VASDRTILHVDMDAFFASVEQLDDPGLRGRPVLVGGRGRRGVVAAASYEARVFGCRSAQPTAVALRLCPHAEVVKPRGTRYRELSDRVFGILGRFSPLVQPISVDEAFVDVSGSARLFGDGAAIGREIRGLVTAETGLTASVGVAPNKFLAKLASDLDKPDGLVVIEPGRVLEVLDPLPVSRLWGVGPASEARLGRLGLRTVGDVRAIGEGVLAETFGDFGRHLSRLSRGEDDRPVHADHEAKTISHEQTFGVDLEDPEHVRSVLLAQCEDVGRRLRRHGRRARTVTVKIRFGDFETVTRSGSREEATDATGGHLGDGGGAVRRVGGREGGRRRHASRGFRPVRLIGAGVSHLSEPGEGTGPQMGLFDAGESERRSKLDALTDAIADKHGAGAIRRMRSMASERARKAEGDVGAGERRDMSWRRYGANFAVLWHAPSHPIQAVAVVCGLDQGGSGHVEEASHGRGDREQAAASGRRAGEGSVRGRGVQAAGDHRADVLPLAS